MLTAFRKLYGSNPLHLLVLIAGLALAGYVIATIGLEALWNPKVWWQSIIVWFAAAIIVHDLVLFPVYALADRLLQLPRRDSARQPRVPLINHVRVPALASGLTFLVFLPGIIEQGAPAYRIATGQTQEPFLGRWLLLCAVMFALSAAVYAVRLVATSRPVTSPTE